jgi:gamma-glutamylcysteine synthetase
MDNQKLFGTLKEISNSMTRVDGEKTFQKEAINSAAEEHQISKKLIRKLAKAYHKQNYTEEKATAEEFSEIYESVVGEV